MFIKLFKSNHQILLSFLLVIGAIIWIYSFVNPLPPPPPLETELVYKMFYALLIQLHPTLIVLIAFGLLFLQSVVLNNLVINHTLIEKNTFLPALLYFVLMSSLPQFCTFSPIYISNLLMLICFNVLMKIYLKEDTFETIFNISILISLISLFYSQAIFYIVFIWLSFLIYGIYRWRQWLISIIGFVVPYIFVVFYFFWFDNLKFTIKFFDLFYLADFSVNYKNVIFISSMLLLMFSFFAAVKYYNYTSERIVMLRKYAGVLLAFYFVSVLSIYSLKENKINHIMSVFLPASIFISHFFIKLKKGWIAEVCFFVLIIIIVINRILIF